MKAIVYTRYGPPDVLQFQDVPKPTPAGDQVLIKLYAASVNPLDRHFMRGKPLFVCLMSGSFSSEHVIAWLKLLYVFANGFNSPRNVTAEYV